MGASKELGGAGKPNTLFSVGHGRALVMGVVNVTPDSFSDGNQLYSGRKRDLDKILFYVETLINEGADILDIGGESTRPGASFVSESEEIDRVIPVVMALAARFDTPLSVDTSSPAVITLAATAGAALVNDVRALRRPGALAAVAGSNLSICLMHMRGDPQTMQQEPEYGDVVAEVGQFLAERVVACEVAGIDRARLIIDPGFGFGKTLAHNLSLLRGLPELVAQGLPVMVGLSRKRIIGEVLGKPVLERKYGSIALALLAAERGACIVRVHDVAATVDVLKVLSAVVDL